MLNYSPNWGEKNQQKKVITPVYERQTQAAVSDIMQEGENPEELKNYSKHPKTRTPNTPGSRGENTHAALDRIHAHAHTYSKQQASSDLPVSQYKSTKALKNKAIFSHYAHKCHKKAEHQL